MHRWFKTHDESKCRLTCKLLQFCHLGEYIRLPPQGERWDGLSVIGFSGVLPQNRILETLPTYGRKCKQRLPRRVTASASTIPHLERFPKRSRKPTYS